MKRLFILMTAASALAFSFAAIAVPDKPEAAIDNAMKNARDTTDAEKSGDKAAKKKKAKKKQAKATHP